MLSLNYHCGRVALVFQMFSRGGLSAHDLFFKSMCPPKDKVPCKKSWGSIFSCLLDMQEHWSQQVGTSVHVHSNGTFPTQLSLPSQFCLSYTVSQITLWFITRLVQTHLERPSVGTLGLILFSFLLRGQNVNVVEETEVSSALALSVLTASCLIHHSLQDL